MSLSFLLSACLIATGPAVCQMTEHAKDSIDAVILTADKGITISQRDTISSENAVSLSEVLSRNPSLNITDNGGPGGLKTVSLRGMGSSHTAIYIDGIRVGNVQSGQNDLGMFDIKGSTIVVDYTQNSININTAMPSFGEMPVAGNAGMDAGSFGTWLPFMRLDFRLSENIALSANANGTFSKGDFEFGEGLRRRNNDISQIRTGIDLFGTTDIGNYHIKAFYNDSRRGTPGSINLPSEDRQADRNAFLQGNMKIRFSDLYRLSLSAKGGYDHIFYSSSWGDSSYGQTDLQFNTVHDFAIYDWWRLSAAAGINWTGLKSTSYDMTRLSSLSAIASTFKAGVFSADIALEYSFAVDKGGKFRDALSPSANMRFEVMKGLDINILGRRLYRIPVFNELYYTGYGNPGLRSEDAWTAGAGTEFRHDFGKQWNIEVGADGFYTLLTDKITSAPTKEDPNIWMPLNIGRVRSVGFDSNAGAEFIDGEWLASIDVAYSFLSSIDRTPDSHTFGQQIPYTSRHSLSACGNFCWKGWSIHAAWNLRCGYLGSSRSICNWNTLDLTLSKSLKIKNIGTFILKCSSKNIAGFRYELASGYPMPGRSIFGGIEYKF